MNTADALWIVAVIAVVLMVVSLVFPPFAVENWSVASVTRCICAAQVRFRRTWSNLKPMNTQHLHRAPERPPRESGSEVYRAWGRLTPGLNLPVSL